MGANFNLPSRKEMNEEKFSDLISNLAEFTEGGDRSIHGELFTKMFNDLSATNQEKYIKTINDRLKEKMKNGN